MAADAQAELDALLDQLTLLESPETTGSNKHRRKLDVALQLCEAHLALDLNRGVVQYAALAIDVDAECVAAHVYKCEALRKLCEARPSAKAKARALKACDRGRDACGRVVSLEGLSAYRERLDACRAVLGAIDAGPPPPPKMPRPAPATTAAPAPPARIPAAKKAPRLKAPPPPGAAPPTTADVRAASGAGPRKSTWNVKDTWEETDVSSWAVERLAELLAEAGPLDAGEPRVRFYDLRKVAGHAQVVIFQRKIRYIFDFDSLELGWVAETDGGVALYKGSLTARDVANGCAAADLDLATSFAPKTDDQRAAKAYLNAKGDAGARGAVARAVAAFESEFTHLSAAGISLAARFHRSRRLAPPDGAPEPPEVLDAKRDIARRQALKDDLRHSHPNLKVTM